MLVSCHNKTVDLNMKLSELVHLSVKLVHLSVQLVHLSVQLVCLSVQLVSRTATQLSCIVGVAFINRHYFNVIVD